MPSQQGTEIKPAPDSTLGKSRGSLVPPGGEYALSRRALQGRGKGFPCASLSAGVTTIASASSSLPPPSTFYLLPLSICFHFCFHPSALSSLYRPSSFKTFAFLSPAVPSRTAFLILTLLGSWHLTYHRKSAVTAFLLCLASQSSASCVVSSYRPDNLKSGHGCLHQGLLL